MPDAPLASEVLVPDAAAAERALVSAEDVFKVYGPVRALSGLNLSVRPREVYGLLGPNGAGKTTTLRILSALETPTSGRVRVLGYDPATQRVEVKRSTGYVAESAVLYESLTPREYFEFVASTRELDQSVSERVARLASVLDIGGNLDVPVGALSLGTKQKISIIAALMHKPRLLLLDEPLNGLDAKSGRILKELISLHVEEGGAVVFSTHVMEVAEAVCTKIGIIDGGSIVAEGTMAELRELAGSGRTSLEDVFLKITKEEAFVAEAVARLREDASDGYR
jgi:ABC-2 type transport system ATP-binding protein